MSFLSNLSARLPFKKEEEIPEHFFALNIGPENLEAALWTVEDKELKVIRSAYSNCSSEEEITDTADKLLDQVLGSSSLEPDKILFGVPDSWLLDDDLKEPKLKLLRDLVKELELKPMAYVATSHAIAHLLEKNDGVPPTAILAEINKQHLTITVTRAGKVDRSKVVPRGDSLGEDIEKALASFTDIEVLPSKILIYGAADENAGKYRDQLLSYPWMARLSFLHFPKIEVLQGNINIKSISLAGAVELEPAVRVEKDSAEHSRLTHKASELIEPADKEKDQPLESKVAGIGFIAGDILRQEEEIKKPVEEPLESRALTAMEEEEALPPKPTETYKGTGKKFSLPIFAPKKALFIPLLIILALVGAYLLVPSAQVKVFVEPRVLERDAQVTADPAIKEVDKEGKKIPGEIVEILVSGTEQGEATGRKEIGEPAKGSVVIYNKTDSAKTFSKGITLTAGGGLKFTLDSSVTVASQSARTGGIDFGKANGDLTAKEIGADGNLPSGTQFTIENLSTSEFLATSEGNFAGGTSKEVTVVTDADQQKLLAQVASNLRKDAQQKLTEKLKGQSEPSDKRILEEALSEEITKKSYSKDINDQASEFSLNLTIRFKGTAYSDSDLRSIVSELVSTNVPEGFELNLAETETQADVSKLEKDGRLIFLARFKAKLTPKVDIESLRRQIVGKTPAQAAQIIRSSDDVLGSDIRITPPLPSALQRLPILSNRIKIEVGLK